MSDLRPIVLCSERACARPLTPAECRDHAAHDGRCEGCWALHLDAFALPVPPRLPALAAPPAPPVAALPVFATARERVYFMAERVPCAEAFDASRETVRVRGAA